MRCIDSALVRRLLPLAIFLVFAAGCSANKPGEKVVAPLPTKVVGTVPKAQQATVPAQYKNGDPTAGKQVFATAGCAGCHTLKDAGSTAQVGPDLDQLKPDAATVERQVTNGGGGMPAFKSILKAPEIKAVSQYVANVAGQ
jgi:mono/diheme cytochrome c family protein